MYDKVIADAAREYIAIEAEYVENFFTDSYKELRTANYLALDKLMYMVRAEKEGLKPEDYDAADCKADLR